MTPYEIANKFASASATCQNGKCPYTAQCRGTTETCKMKEVAMIIRTLMAEISEVNARNKILEGMANYMCDYIRDLESINERYYRLAHSFQQGYRTNSKIRRKPPRSYKKIDPALMDGNPKYEYEEPKEKVDLPVVII